MLLKHLTGAATALCSACMCLVLNQSANAAEPQTVIETCKKIQAENKALTGSYYGVFDSNLKWVLQPIYRQIREMYPNYFLVIEDGSNLATLIDTSLTPHKKYPLDKETSKAGDFREHGCPLIWLNVPVKAGEDPRKNLLYSTGQPGSYGMKRATGEVFIEPLYDDIVFDGDGKTFEAKSHDKKTNKQITTIIDSSGHPTKFENIAQLNGTLRFGISTVEAQTKPGEPQRFGVINSNGKLVYPMKLSYCVSKLTNAYGQIEENGVLYHLVIDQNGKEVIRTKDEVLAGKISDEMDAKKRDEVERAAQGKLKMKWIDNRHHAVIDLAGKYVLPPSSILLQPISNDKFIANPLGPEWQRFYPNMWAKELDGCAMFAYFLKDFDLIGMNRDELLKHLGAGDSAIDKDESGDELFVYSRMRGASVQVKLHEGKVCAWRVIDKDHKEPWIEKNVLIPDASDPFLVNLQFAVTKVSGADLPKGKVWPPGTNE